LDGSIKTAIIDETLPVFQLVDVICARIGITNTDEYSLLPEKAEVEEVVKTGMSIGKDKFNRAMTTGSKKATLKVVGQIADDGT
jgi:hypothetical protein